MRTVLLALVGLYALGVLVVTAVTLFGAQADTERARAIRELGASYVVEPVLEQPMLAAACEGKLERGGPGSIVGYVRPMRYRPMLDQAIDDVLVGTTHERNLQVEVRRLDGSPTGKSAAQAVRESLNPLTWVSHFARANRGTPELSEARYVVIANYVSVQPPIGSGASYAVGSGSFSAEVVRLADGVRLCEGRGDVHMRQSVNAGGATREEARANAQKLLPFVFARAVMISPLRDVCLAGGEALCQVAEKWAR